MPGSKREWEGACVDRVNSMMRRELQTNPSVLIWSLGNESYVGDVFRAMYKQRARTRPEPTSALRGRDPQP